MGLLFNLSTLSGAYHFFPQCLSKFTDYGNCTAKTVNGVLTTFTYDPGEMNLLTGINGTSVTNWYFETEEEMLGVLEEQANLFLEKAFKWLERHEDVDIMKISHERAAERARINYTGTQEEKENLLQEIRVKLEE